MAPKTTPVSLVGLEAMAPKTTPAAGGASQFAGSNDVPQPVDDPEGYTRQVNLSEVVKALQCNSTSTLTTPLRRGCWCWWFGLHADSEHVDVMKQQITMQVIPSKHLILFHQIQDHKQDASRALLQAMMTNTTVRNLILRVDFLEEPHLTATVHAFVDNHALRCLKICAWEDIRCSEDAIRMAFEKIMEKNMSLRKIQVQDGDAQKMDVLSLCRDPPQVPASSDHQSKCWLSEQCYDQWPSAADSTRMVREGWVCYLKKSFQNQFECVYQLSLIHI